jgi:transposase
MSVKLNDSEIEIIIEFLRKQKDVYVGKEEECRQFIKGVFWILRSGAQWRELPEEYGKWNSVFKRWSQKGIWQRMQEALIKNLDLENLLMDSTVIRAHPCSAGAKGGEIRH